MYRGGKAVKVCLDRLSSGTHLAGQSARLCLRYKLIDFDRADY
jgi:hypothetical protein